MRGRAGGPGAVAALVAAFVVVHAGLAVLGVLVVPRAAFYDLELYRWWAWVAQQDGPLAVLADGWVYPAGALVPILAAATGGAGSTVGYAVTWCALVTMLDAVAVVALARRGSRAGAWWWLAFLALLGPVAMGRLDAIIAPMCVVALVLVSRSPAHARAASALLAAGAWIKVAPGALLLPLLAARRRPVSEVILPGVLVTLAVVAPVTALGGAGHLLGFLADQGGRGMQIEAVGASPWMLARLATDAVVVGYNTDLSTFEVTGPGTTAAARVLDVALVTAVLTIGVALVRARRRGVGDLVLLPASLAVMVALFVTDKVGSPQYVTWVAAPIAVALSYPVALRSRSPLTTGPTPGHAGGADAHPRWLRAAAGVALATSALTQAVFPWGYPDLLDGGATTTAVLVVRNGLLLVLLGCATVGVRTAMRQDPDDPGRREDVLSRAGA